MWFIWMTLALLSCAHGEQTTEETVQVQTTEETVQASASTARPPPRTLDRKAGELAWKNWLQESKAPPRRIITKSLFITPQICPKGQRLERNSCVQVVTLNKDEHERNLLDQLNALFTSAPGGDDLYDYGEEDPGPFQLSIPIGLEFGPSPLQSQDSSAQNQEFNPVLVDKKEGRPIITDYSIEAELELLKLESIQDRNETGFPQTSVENKVVDNFIIFADKLKRDSNNVNATEIESNNSTDEGQKEIVFGNVNIDPILYITEMHNKETKDKDDVKFTIEDNKTDLKNVNNLSQRPTVMHEKDADINLNNTATTETNNNTEVKVLDRDTEKPKLNPENDYADISEAIKLISRYAEVTTDDNFEKDQKKNSGEAEGFLGTRTKLQHRRNKLKPMEPTTVQETTETQPKMYNTERVLLHKYNPRNEVYYRYPWAGQNVRTPPPDYPFRHLQDYWPGRQHTGGVYGVNTGHENPRRHHHSFPHNSLRPHSYMDYSEYPTGQVYPGPQYPLYPPHRVIERRVHNNHGLYNLLGLRHWFSSESSNKR